MRNSVDKVDTPEEYQVIQRDKLTQNLRIVALYKTFCGEEWVSHSISSIYKWVHKIVFVHSTVSWSGFSGNKVIPAVDEWVRENDVDNKVIQLTGEFPTQDGQYDYGMDYITKNIVNYDFIMLIDTDEIWDDYNLNLALTKYVTSRKLSRINSFKCSIINHIKSIYYIIHPTEGCKPTIFIRRGVRRLSGTRGNMVKPDFIMCDVFYHHFSWLRRNEKELMQDKLSADAGEPGSVQFRKYLKDWFRNEWKRIPNVHGGFFPLPKLRGCWNTIKIVDESEIPSIIREDRTMLVEYGRSRIEFDDFKKTDYYKNLPIGYIEPGDEETLYRYSKNKKLCVETGTLLGRSTIITAYRAESVITIDVFEDLHLIEDDKNRKFNEDWFNKHQHSYERVKNSLEVYKNISVKRRADIDNFNFNKNSIDMIFLDADHSYDGVKKDFEYFYPYVRRGGLILFHDSLKLASEPHCEVWKFLSELKDDSRVAKTDEKARTTVWVKK